MEIDITFDNPMDGKELMHAYYSGNLVHIEISGVSRNMIVSGFNNSSAFSFNKSITFHLEARESLLEKGQ